MMIETLARALHEAGREAVLQNKVHKLDGAPVGQIVFKEWGEISEDAREGRRMQARWLLGHFKIYSIDVPCEHGTGTSPVVHWCSACRQPWVDNDRGWYYLATVGCMNDNKICPRCSVPASISPTSRGVSPCLNAEQSEQGVSIVEARGIEDEKVVDVQYHWCPCCNDYIRALELARVELTKNREENTMLAKKLEKFTLHFPFQCEFRYVSEDKIMAWCSDTCDFTDPDNCQQCIESALPLDDDEVV